MTVRGCSRFNVAAEARDFDSAPCTILLACTTKIKASLTPNGTKEASLMLDKLQRDTPTRQNIESPLVITCIPRVERRPGIRANDG